MAASDPNHPNPYLFTGRRFDRETGLYYYRARYYNPYIGRFMQTDPVGYDDGMNWYLYCRNNPVNMTDENGLRCFKMQLKFSNANLTFKTNWACLPFTQQILNKDYGGNKLNEQTYDINDTNCPPGEHCEWGWKVILAGATFNIPDFVELPPLLIPESMKKWIPESCVITVKGTITISGWWQYGKCVPDDKPDDKSDTAPSGNFSNHEDFGLTKREYFNFCAG